MMMSLRILPPHPLLNHTVLFSCFIAKPEYSVKLQYIIILNMYTKGQNIQNTEYSFFSNLLWNELRANIKFRIRVEGLEVSHRQESSVSHQISILYEWRCEPRC